MRRRTFLGALALLASPVRVPAKEVAFDPVVPGRAIAFPRDHGAHPGHRNEWWYVTGWLRTAAGDALGFQVTFFRFRPPFAVGGRSSFAPAQVLLAHAALSDPRRARLLHDERASRAVLGLAGASEATTDVWIDDWSLQLRDGRYAAGIRARDFALELVCEPPGPPLLQGEGGYSRKGPQPEQASYYYSRPQLAVSGRVSRGRTSEAVSGTGWLDHEWSSTLMAPEAAGWDWIGINLHDGGALMVFRMRDRSGATLYSGGTLLAADGRVRHFAHGEAEFEPVRTWRSPHSGTTYPVGLRVSVGRRSWTMAPLFDDQELDARASTGTIYWEGAVRCLEEGRETGRGYLELTGYWRVLNLNP